MLPKGKFRDCNCEHTRDHHSFRGESSRCLHEECNCTEYIPMGVIKEVKPKLPNLNDINLKYKFEEEFEYGKKVWYVIEKPISVIATCYDEKDAERISDLLNFMEKVNMLNDFAKDMLKPMIVEQQSSKSVKGET